jgi:hypothetical protein
MYQIVAYIVGFHVTCNMPIFENFNKVIQNVFESWIFQKPVLLNFWKSHQIILASHMESFILGSEWHLFIYFLQYSKMKWNNINKKL